MQLSVPKFMKNIMNFGCIQFLIFFFKPEGISVFFLNTEVENILEKIIKTRRGAVFEYRTRVVENLNT